MPHKKIIDIKGLQKFISENKVPEYYYVLADGQIVMFEIEKDTFIPWCFEKEDDVQIVTNNFKLRNDGKNYQYIRTIEKIENWR